MAATRKSSGRKRTAKRSSARKRGSSSVRRGGNKAIDRASASLDAAQKAFTDLRKELSKGGSTLIKDAQLRNTEKLVKDARRTYGSVSKKLLKDLDDLQKAAAGKKKSTKRKSSSKKRKSSTKRKSSSSAKRKSSSAKRSTKSGAKRTKAAAKGAKSGAKRGAAGAKKKSR